MDMEHPLQYEEGVATTLQEMDWNVVETNKKHTRVVLLAACLFCGGFGFGTELGQGGEAYFTQEEGDPWNPTELPCAPRGYLCQCQEAHQGGIATTGLQL